jgi:hypothetical protein
MIFYGILTRTWVRQERSRLTGRRSRNTLGRGMWMGTASLRPPASVANARSMGDPLN